jgi:hypothetical protein
LLRRFGSCEVSLVVVGSRRTIMVVKCDIESGTGDCPGARRRPIPKDW